MNTQIKTDALLDAFDKMELTKGEMDKLIGGDCIDWDFTSNTGHVAVTQCAEGSTYIWTSPGGTRKYTVTAQWLIDYADDYAR